MLSHIKPHSELLFQGTTKKSFLSFIADNPPVLTNRITPVLYLLLVSWLHSFRDKLKGAHLDILTNYVGLDLIKFDKEMHPTKLGSTLVLEL